MESNNIYKTYSVYEQLKDNLLLPNMSYVEDVQKVCLQDEPLETLDTQDLNYFYIEALEDNLKVAFISDITENVLQYSTDKETWHTLNPTYNNDVAGYSLEDYFEYVDYTLPINANEKIWFKGKLTVEYMAPDSVDAEVMPTDTYYEETFPVGNFYISKPCNVGGNIFSLTYGNDFTNKTKFKDIESFQGLFQYNNIVDASNLILPATKLTNGCYASMFEGCTFLTSTPQLPATTLADGCYSYMLSGCTSLITAPELPATELVTACYRSMFSGCTSLINAPEFLATTLATNCYEYMLSGCTSLIDIRINVLNEYYGFHETFNYCESLSNVYLIGDAPEDVYCIFEDILEKNINVYCTLNTYTISNLPSHYTINITDADFVEYKSLVINSANNVNSKDTYTTVGYTITETYNKNGESVDIEISDSGMSNQFEENTSTDQIERTISFTYKNAITAETTITQSAYIDATDKNYLCITALTDGTFRYNNPANKTLYYSQSPYMYADGSGWTELNEIELFVGQSIYIKGTGVSNGNVYDNIFYSTCKFDVSGNIMSLIYSDDFEDKYELTDGYTFNRLFSKTYIVDASQLILPATTLSSYCHYYMFNKCTSLTTAPQLPATTLAPSCYYHMFDGCTSLVNVPSILPATTLAGYCYNSMFRGCTSLVIVPQLPATTLATYCYQNMFEGCTSIISAPELPATTLATNCYYEMFFNCTSLVTAPELPATTLANSCYSQMFRDCISLTNAPQLPATTLATQCYKNMFGNCTSLVTAPELPATTLANSCYEYMLQGCKLLTTAPQLPATTLADSCYGYMFYKCTSLTTAPELPATELEEWCYAYMFEDCTSLTTAPELPATTLSTNCYYRMFRVCTSLTNIPSILPATTLAYECYKYMFSNCVSLTEAPQLPATTLADSCYYGMFEFCTSLTTAPELPATTVASYCYSHMFYGCSSLVNVPSELPAINLTKYCYQYMFYRCISLVTAPKLLGAALATYCYQYMFYECRKLSNITMLASSLYSSSMYYWVYKVASTGTFYKHPTITSTSLSTGNHGIPSGWNVVDYGEVVECTSLTITAPDVTWRATNAPITYTAIVNLNVYGTIYQNITQTGTVTSEEFPQNMDPDNTVEHTLSYTYMGITATTTITQGTYVDSNYTVNLNNQWQLSTTYSNLDESQYDGIYESFSNYHSDSTNAVMYVNISGYTQFRLYIGSYGESSYDYTIASALDSTSNKLTTSGFQYQPTALSSFKEVVYDNIDGGEHTITITYRKDGSANNNDDRGYLLIPKIQ